MLCQCILSARSSKSNHNHFNLKPQYDGGAYPTLPCAEKAMPPPLTRLHIAISPLHSPSCPKSWKKPWLSVCFKPASRLLKYNYPLREVYPYWVTMSFTQHFIFVVWSLYATKFTFFCCGCTIQHIFILLGESTMLNHCTHNDTFQRQQWFTPHKLQCIFYFMDTRQQLLVNFCTRRTWLSSTRRRVSIERRLGSGRLLKITGEMREAAFREVLRFIIICLISHGLDIATCVTFLHMHT